MCLAIYSESDTQPLELAFAFERILQRRDGTVDICVDLLIKNNSPTEFCRRLFVALPHSVVDVESRLNQCRNDNEGYAALESLRRYELGIGVSLGTSEFSQCERLTHWPYRCVPHLEIDKRNCDGGNFTVVRKSRKEAWGFVKSGWILDRPAWLEPHSWILVAANQITLFEIVLSSELDEKTGRPVFDQMREALRPNEQMWVRLRIKVPARGFNKKSWFQLNFPKFVDYKECFYSSTAAVDLIDSRISFFNTYADGFNTTFPNLPRIGEELNKASHTLKQRGGLLPPKNQRLVEIDWRAFLYREHGINTVSIEFPIATPSRPIGSQEYVLPFEAFPPGAKIGFWPSCLNGLVSKLLKNTTAACEEMWIGNSHLKNNLKGYVVQIGTRKENSIYPLFAWLGFIGFVLGVISFLSLVGWLRFG